MSDVEGCKNELLKGDFTCLRVLSLGRRVHNFVFLIIIRAGTVEQIGNNEGESPSTQNLEKGESTRIASAV